MSKSRLDEIMSRIDRNASDILFLTNRIRIYEDVLRGVIDAIGDRDDDERLLDAVYLANA